MADTEFSAALSAWARQSEDRLEAVFKDAVQQVANDVRIPKAMGGNMPVDTGNLRRSLTASTSEMPSLKPRDVLFEGDRQGEVLLTIANSKLGDTIYLGFQAIYAPYQEEKNGFVRLTAQRWPTIVAKSAAKIEKAVEG